MIGNPVLRHRDTAAYLGVSIATLYNIRKDPAMKFPPVVRITSNLLIGWAIKDLDAWVESRKQQEREA